MPESIAKVLLRNNAFVELDLLKTEHVRHTGLDELIEGLFAASPQAVYIP